MTVEQSVSGAFAALSQMFQEAETSNSWMPDDGEHECVLVGVTSKPSDFKYKTDSGEPLSAPGVIVVFEFQLTADPSASAPRQFRGVPFRFPSAPAGLPDSVRQRLTYEMARFKGHVQTALGRKVEDPMVGLVELAGRASGSNPPVLVVKVTTNKKGYRTEYVNKLLSSGSAES